MTAVAPLTWKTLPLCNIKPTGWLRNQLRIQADGLSGHLDEFWPSVQDSSWIGGSTDDTERMPYWLDGLVPLAWQLDDDVLKEKAHRHVQTIIANQHEDGWFSSCEDTGGNIDRSRGNDPWTPYLVAKVLVQYHDVTGDEKALNALVKLLQCMLKRLQVDVLFGWGYYRWTEVQIGAYYAYEQTGEAWLLELIETCHQQGNDWHATFDAEDITVPTPRRGRWKWAKHVVNLAMVIKGYPLYSRLSGEQADRDFIYKMIATLDKYHGQVTGVFTGDECISGKNPTQGTELCAVADYMYSLGQAMTVLADPLLADRLERITFNAWPATFSPDMWAHQYDQQANQVIVAKNDDYMWSTNGPESNLYGLEPNFGCCTANMHMGWPKFVSHLWMETENDGLAVTAYAPSVATFAPQGVPVSVALDTDYPFRETLTFTVSAESPVTFPLQLRIPAWAKNASLTVDGTAIDADALRCGTYVEIQREWSGETELVLTLPMTAATQRRYNQSVTVERGPLVYSLKIGEKWVRVNEDVPGRELPHADWEVHPATDWNYGLVIDESDLAASLTFEELPIGDCPFSPEGAPMQAKAMAKQLPGWGLKHGSAEELPLAGLAGMRTDAAAEEVTLIPYGCTNLRLTEFPLMQPDSDA